MERRFSGQIFGLTGSHHYIHLQPIFDETNQIKSDTKTSSRNRVREQLEKLRSLVTIVSIDLIEKAIIDNGGYIGNKHIWQHEQIIIVGGYDFDTDYLDMSIRLFLDPSIVFTCQYFSADAFVDFLIDGTYPHYYQGDSRVRRHEGLRYLASRGFTWPSIHAIPQSERTTGTFQNRREAHPLRSKYGYSVSEGLSEPERQRRLARAIQPHALGLKAVVEHIASLVRLSKLRTDRQNAIDIWETDLEWLYQTYYKHSPYSFIWPTVS